MNPVDVVEKIHGAILQHGRFNNRIYLMKLGDSPEGPLWEELISLAEYWGYEKICLKIPRSKTPFFLNQGFREEASITGLYSGHEEGVFLGLFRSSAREKLGNKDVLDDILTITKEKSTSFPLGRGPSDFIDVESLGENHAEEMALLYREVFPSYPFPIDRPDYLIQTMNSHVHYFGIRHQGKLVALSSAETDTRAKNVEMTDFATLPAFRGQNLAQRLLAHMENHMDRLGFCTAYTIARALSPGMNITFARQGYSYGGRLVNNTQISGQIESMNVWHKVLGT